MVSWSILRLNSLLQRYSRVFVVLVIYFSITFQQQEQSQDLTEQEKNLEIFYGNYVKAQKDHTNYKDKFSEEFFLENLSSDEKLTNFYYLNNEPANYIVSFPKTEFFLTRIMVNPCKSRTQFCCEGLAMCEDDQKDIIAGGDLEIAWTTNNFLPICEKEFDNDDCGVFLEIHRPGSSIIISELKIQDYIINGFKTAFLSTKKLCAGKYEIWFVQRLRSGSYIVYVKPFFVRFPGCTCSQIESFGYNCTAEQTK